MQDVIIVAFAASDFAHDVLFLFSFTSVWTCGIRVPLLVVRGKRVAYRVVHEGNVAL